MPKVFAQYAEKMDRERRQRIWAAIEQSGAHLGSVQWFQFDDGTGTELAVYFSSSNPKGRARAVRLVAALRGCGMTVGVEEYRRAGRSGRNG